MKRARSSLDHMKVMHIENCLDVAIFYFTYRSITCCTEFSENSNIMDTCAQNEDGNLLKPNLL